MIPGTLLGLAVLAACIVPGFVFISVAERRRTQIPRSSLVEATELLGIGAITSLVSVALVAGLARGIHLYDAKELADRPRLYALESPFRVLAPCAFVFLLSCAIAWIAARCLLRREARVFDPGGAVWTQLLHTKRPSDKVVLAQVEMRDGTYVTGYVTSFSMGDGPDRELAINGPISVQRPGETTPTNVLADFVLFREGDIVRVLGGYHDSAPG